MSAAERQALWARLHAAGLVEGDAPAEAAQSPWFVRAMLGVAGWIGALFLLMFVGVGLEFIIRSEGASLFAGAVACGAAAWIFIRFSQTDFMTQFALAISLAGQALIAFGLAQMVKDAGAVGFVMAGVQTSLFFLVPNGIHRIWAAGTTVVALTVSLMEAGLQPCLPGVLAVALGLAWLNELGNFRQRHLLRAAGYGIALAALPIILVGAGMWGMGELLRGDQLPQWVGGILAAGALLWVTYTLLRREGVDFGSPVGQGALASAALLALVSVKAPGLAPAAVILLLGFANGNRVLAGFGILALLCYLGQYYYFLQLTLLHKSLLLVSAGAALLLVRLMARRLLREAQAEAGHA